MAEYYALLNRAVSALQRNDEAARRDIYVKARSALIKQLKAIEPPLPAAEISKQRLSLEDAIRRIERESIEAAEANKLSDDEIARRAEAALAEALGGSGGRGHGAAASHAAEPPPPPQYEDEEEEELIEEPSYGEPEDVPFAEVVPPQPRAAHRAVPNPPPFERASKVTDVDSAPLQGGPLHGRAQSSRTATRDWDRSRNRRRERRSAVGQLIWFLLFVVVIGAIAYFVWANWDDVSDFIDSITGETSETSDADTPEADAAAVDVTPPVDEAPEVADVGEAPAPARLVTPEPASEADVLIAEASFTLTPADPAAPPQSYDATVRWSLQDGDAGPLVAGTISVPDRGLLIFLQIGQSPDPNVSHELSVLATVDPASGNPSVSSIPNVWVKVSPDGSPVALEGTPEETSDLYFMELPAASALENTTRLRISPWFEIALVFESGEAATVTFSKGSAGDAVFSDALAAWDAAG